MNDSAALVPRVEVDQRLVHDDRQAFGTLAQLQDQPEPQG